MSSDFDQSHADVPEDAEEWKSRDAARILRRHKARRRLSIILAAAIAAGSAYWYLNRFFSLSLDQAVSFENIAENKVADELAKTFSAPPPLVAPTSTTRRWPASSNAITIKGVIAGTNAGRQTNGGLPPLAENAILDAIATLRLDDMFQNQYFAHVSPYTSSSAETIAKTFGYQSIALGENLALGNFGGDQGVVNAWMASPGHRANILNTHYTEIGVAARQGVFQGETTWIAVQVFGRPASDCPAPDAALKAKIDAENAELRQMENDLASKKTALDAMKPQYGSAYNQAVDAYNAEVNQYNALLGETKANIATYNGAVQAFNQCIGA